LKNYKFIFDHLLIFIRKSDADFMETVQPKKIDENFCSNFGRKIDENFAKISAEKLTKIFAQISDVESVCSDCGAR
jgi:hypothetical protein